MNPVDVFKALSEESRLRMVHVLSRGFFNVQELTSLLDLSQSTVSHHLKVLQQSGLLRHHKEGTWSYYSLVEAGDARAPARMLVQPFIDLLQGPSANGTREMYLADMAGIDRILERRRDHSLRFFERVASDWNELRHEAQGDDSYVERVIPLIRDDATLIELGCGSGALLKRLLPRSGRTIGVDSSPAMLEEARKTLGDLSSAMDLRLGYLEHLPLESAIADTALAYMVLHHVASPEAALRDTARVLKPGASLVIVDLVKHTREYMRERYADLWLGFDPQEFASWVLAAGFGKPKLSFLGADGSAFLLTTTKL